MEVKIGVQQAPREIHLESSQTSEEVSAAVAAVVPDVPLDEFNPVLAMLQTWVERSEPANYAPMIARAPVTGDDGQPLAPKDVFQSEGFVDHIFVRFLVQ